MTIDIELKFEPHTRNMSNKETQTLGVLNRLSTMVLKGQVIDNFFFISGGVVFISRETFFYLSLNIFHFSVNIFYFSGSIFLFLGKYLSFSGTCFYLLRISFCFSENSINFS